MVTGAFLCLTLLQPAIASPFRAPAQNPFTQILGLPPPIDARLAQPSYTRWSTSLTATNTLNVESNAQEQLYADYESYLLTLELDYGLTNEWALKLIIPLSHRGKGIFDNAIDGWHEAFGLPRADRPKVTDNQFQISYQQNGISAVNLKTTNEGLTDIQLGLGHQLWQNNQSAVSAWLIADLPTGNPDKLNGNDRLDLSIQLSAEQQFAPGWRGFANFGALFPGNSPRLNTNINPYASFATTGLTWQAFADISIQVQLNGHTSLYRDSKLRFLSDTYSIVFGGGIRISPCSQLDIAVSEDLKVGASPDVSLLISWHQSASTCRE